MTNKKRPILFTGFHTDRNRQLFEGDIVKTRGSCNKVYVVKNMSGSFFFHHKSLKLYLPIDYDLDRHGNCKFMKMGNIRKNPELLKKHIY